MTTRKDKPRTLKVWAMVNKYDRSVPAVHVSRYKPEAYFGWEAVRATLTLSPKERRKK